MICISWNARGLGNPRAFCDLRRLITERRPDVLFICETKLKACRTKLWNYYFNFEGLFSVDAQGRSGGLFICWKRSVEVHIKSYSCGHIDCIINLNQDSWRFTGPSRFNSFQCVFLGL